MMILLISSRRDGRSLGDTIKSELGPVPGLIRLFGVLMIMIIVLPVWQQPLLLRPGFGRSCSGIGPVAAAARINRLFTLRRYSGKRHRQRRRG
jgi:hypothetical protein